MPGDEGRCPPAARYRIERAERGYRVVGPGLLVWEPVFRQVLERRQELEAPGWRHPLRSPLSGEPSAPFASIVYGPVESRRLGRSLGLNLSPPGRRACTFRCVYCPYTRAPARRAGARWPTPEAVGAHLREAAAGVGPIDSITISGHGEPTLHPRFPEVVECILAEARRGWPGVPVRILTNGSRAVFPDVREALDRLDERIVKLDPDLARICRPRASQPLGAALFGVSLLKDVTLQSCFVEGAASNTEEAAILEWLGLVSEIAPRAVQIYTIDQQPPSADIRPVSAAHLEEIACRLRARTGIEALVCA